ncbi:MAG: DUF1295 domain-containing protein [Candidatus Binatia bacterium]|nr:DUF1295 domain-containing protein [Candidatus Binatia bacterium]
MSEPVSRPRFTESRAASFVYIGFVYVVVLAAVWWMFGMFAASPVVAIVLGLLVAALICWFATLAVNNGSVFDAYWSVLPPAVAVFLVSDSSFATTTPRQIAVLVVVWVWAIRLTSNWARSFAGLHYEDFRYLELYEKTPLPRWAVQLLLVELAPAVQVILGCLALYPAMTMGSSSFSVLDGVALAIGISAVLLQFVADQQMRKFIRAGVPGANMEAGAWRYSRHPNYFGEILFWVSLWLFSVSAAPEVWWTSIGPLAMIAMFVFASVPMMENRSRARRPGYDVYASRTSALVPWLPKKG